MRRDHTALLSSDAVRPTLDDLKRGYCVCNSCREGSQKHVSQKQRHGQAHRRNRPVFCPQGEWQHKPSCFGQRDTENGQHLDQQEQGRASAVGKSVRHITGSGWATCWKRMSSRLRPLAASRASAIWTVFLGRLAGRIMAIIVPSMPRRPHCCMVLPPHTGSMTRTSGQRGW